jgi:diaminohydroxyphosphoribosylaminopyrimidine deaminase/5-amino-6-(5-phosphoribosylamino)uracil reductase
MLRQAGVEIEIGLCAEEARDVNGGFFHRVETGRPLIAVIDADELRMGDLFYGATFFDAVLTDLRSWLSVEVSHKNAPLCIVVDDTYVTPASMARKPSQEREAIWLIMARGRQPSRINAMQSYTDHVIEVDVFEGGHFDMETIIDELGAQGLTRIAVEEKSPLAKALKVAGLV